MRSHSDFSSHLYYILILARFFISTYEGYGKKEIVLIEFRVDFFEALNPSC